MASMVDPAGLTTTYDRDEDGNITKTTHPSGATYDQVYDPSGNLISFTDVLIETFRQGCDEG
jgi:YD repeat-containing protein